jgi:tetratricopeptide (TPR) repeat protein/predicted Ser/Thr protein kinase
MSCLDEHATLAIFDGTLAPAELDQVTAHLDSCVWCRRLVAEIGRDEHGTDALEVGRFKVTRELGAGGAGVVYEAHDPELDRDVALKLLHTDGVDELLLREARMMAKLSHPNLVAVYEVGRWDEAAFVAMELVDGGTLREWLARSPRTRLEILNVCIGAGRGLVAAHDQQLIHRDLKPENILVGSDARARVSDFGLAHVSASVDPEALVGDLRLTRTGALVGTPAYMAPEQLAGAAVDARSDQFSFCVVLYEALAGARPFTGTTIGDLRAAIGRGEPKRPRGLSSRAWRAIARGLRADPAQRFSNMRALLAELEPRATKRTIAIVAGASAVVAAAIAVVGMRGGTHDACASPTIWNPIQRETVRAAFLRSGSAIAADTFEHTAGEIDRYASAWGVAHVESCRGHARGDASDALLDRRMSCLADRRGELAAMIDLLVTADPKIVEHAPDAVAALVAPSACASPDAIEDGGAEATALRARLRRATARADLDLTDSNDLTAIITRADELHLPRLRAEALYTRGVARMAARDDVNASTDLEEAAYAAEANKLDQLAARSSSLLIAAATDASDLERARRWIRPARAAVARLGTPGEEAAALASRIAWLDYHDGKLADAETEARSAVAAGQHFDVLATVLFGEGKWADALLLYRKNLAFVEDQHGKAHPLVARALDHVASTLERLGKHAEALAMYERALSIVGNSDSGVLAQLLDNSATALLSLGKSADAETRFRRSLAIHERIQGADHPDVATTLVNLANTLDREGRDSLELRQRALKIFERGGDRVALRHRSSTGGGGAISRAWTRDPRQASRPCTSRLRVHPRGPGLGATRFARSGDGGGHVASRARCTGDRPGPARRPRIQSRRRAVAESWRSREGACGGARGTRTDL